MRKAAISIPLFSLAAGGLGFCLRRAEILAVFDPATGLAERGAVQTLGLIAFTAVFFAIIIAFAVFVSARHKSPDGFENAFGIGLFYPISFILISLAWITGTALHFMFLMAASALNTVDVLFAAASALSAVSVAFFAINVYRNPRGKPLYALCVVPIVFLCFWLVLIYRGNATNPVLQSYVYQCLAAAASALSFYYTAGFLYGKPAPGKATVAYAACVYFCCVMLADGVGAGVSLIIGSILVTGAAHMFMFLRKLKPNGQKEQKLEVK